MGNLLLGPFPFFKSPGDEVEVKFPCKTIRHLHISHLIVFKTLHNLRFLFLMGITVVPTEIKEVCKIWGGGGGGKGANKVYYGICKTGELQGKLGDVLFRMV